MNTLVAAWADKPMKVTLGASFVSKFQPGTSFNVDSLVLACPKTSGLGRTA